VFAMSTDVVMLEKIEWCLRGVEVDRKDSILT